MAVAQFDGSLDCLNKLAIYTGIITFLVPSSTSPKTQLEELIQ